MEVSYYIVCVVECNVDPSVSQNYTCQSTDRKKQDEANRKVSWRFILNYTISHCGQPAEYFHTCWYSNYHGSCREVDT